MEIDINILAQAMNVANDGIIITDYRLPDNPIVFVNDAFETMTGYKKDEIVHLNCRFLQKNDRKQIGIKVVKNAISEGKPCRVELRNYKKDGTLFWNELSIAPLIGKNGDITHFVGIQKDITMMKKLEDALFSQVIEDPLTHVYNRLGFAMQADRAISNAKKKNINLYFVMIDIDDFKTINDSFGHSAGDDVLVAFAKFLKMSERKLDIVARYGGDEFILILFEDENFDYEKWLSTFKKNIEELKKSESLPPLFSISIGKSNFSYIDSKSLRTLIKEADAEMYKEKKKNKPLGPR